MNNQLTTLLAAWYPERETHAWVLGTDEDDISFRIGGGGTVHPAPHLQIVGGELPESIALDILAECHAALN
jgi:hypothetical protein